MNGPFILHGTDAIPLDCNTTPLPECTIRPVLRNGEVIKAVEVPMKGCASLWLRCQAEAEKWLTDARTGRLVDDPVRINRRINSAYAFLWLTDRRFQWAGLAAFASKQVGCGLLHAARTIAETGAEIRKRPGQDSFEFLSKNLYELGAGRDPSRCTRNWRSETCTSSWIFIRYTASSCWQATSRTRNALPTSGAA